MNHFAVTFFVLHESRHEKRNWLTVISSWYVATYKKAKSAHIAFGCHRVSRSYQYTIHHDLGLMFTFQTNSTMRFTKVQNYRLIIKFLKIGNSKRRNILAKRLKTQ